MTARKADLTKREQQILGLLAEGWTNDEIAAPLEISPNTVKTHVARILEKLGVGDRRKAGRIAAGRDGAAGGDG